MPFSVLPHQPKRARFAEVLVAIKAELVARAVAPPPLIGIVASDAQPDTKAETVIVLRPRRYMVPQDTVEGAGRIDTRVVRQLDVYVRPRNSADPIDSAQAWLTDPTRGFFDLEEDVLSALQDFAPEDENANLLTVCPIRVLAGAQPDLDAHRLGWGQATATFEVVYMPPISLAEISPSSLADGTINEAYSQTFTQTGAESVSVITAPRWTLAFMGSSETSLAVGTGSKTFTTQPGLPYPVGSTVRATAEDSGAWMQGTVTEYTYAGALTVNVTTTSGTGTKTDWRFSLATLPAGLTLNASTGALTGTPTTAGRYAFVVTCTDTTSKLSGWRRYFLTIGARITPTTLPAGTRGSAYSQALSVAGTTGTVTWSIWANSQSAYNEALPAGLAISSTTGTISGTPTTVVGETYPRVYKLTVQARDAKGNIGRRQYDLTIS